MDTDPDESDPQEPDTNEVIDSIAESLKSPFRGNRDFTTLLRRGRDTATLRFGHDSDKGRVSLALERRDDLGDERVNRDKSARLQLGPVLERYADKYKRKLRELVEEGYTIGTWRDNGRASDMVIPPPVQGRRDQRNLYPWYECRFVYELFRFGLHFRMATATSLFAVLRQIEGQSQVFNYLALLREEMFALEDLGAMLLSVRRCWKRDEQCLYQQQEKTTETPFVFTYMHYPPNQAELSSLFEKGGEDLYSYLAFDVLEEAAPIGELSRETLREALEYVASFLVSANARQDMLFNTYGTTKTKHGSPIVGDPSVLGPAQECFAALLFTRAQTRRASKQSLQHYIPIAHHLIDQEAIDESPHILSCIESYTAIQQFILGLHLRRKYAGTKLPGVLPHDNIEDFVDELLVKTGQSFVERARELKEQMKGMRVEIVK